MKPEWDFSTAERGKFYHSDTVFRFLIYLEPDIDEFVTRLAEQKQVDVQDLVNDLLRTDLELTKSAP